MISVKVDRNQTPEQVIEATQCKPYIDPEVVAKMPRGSGEWAYVYFFKPDSSAYDENGRISDEDLEREYDKQGFIPVDMYSLAAVNKANSAFVDDHPHGTHWKDEDGNWCHGAFVYYDNEHRVHVNPSNRGWNKHWEFAGLPK